MEGEDLAKKSKPQKDAIASAAVPRALYAESSGHGLCRRVSRLRIYAVSWLDASLLHQGECCLPEAIIFGEGCSPQENILHASCS